jgi:endo-1,4-beta-xylanase
MFNDVKPRLIGLRTASALAMLCCACGGPPNDGKPQTTSPSAGTGSIVIPSQPSAPAVCALPLEEAELDGLASTFAPHFRVGVAVSPFTFSSDFNAKAVETVELVERHFNHLSPENLLKWDSIHPNPGEYAFEAADAYVAFGEARGMTIYGHVFVWHQQVPAWVFQDESGNDVSADVLLQRLREHITTVGGRYGGRIQYWDVVNEAFEDNGSLRNTPWRRILGDDYIAQVFQLAGELLPDSKLVYNDYSLATASKRAGALRMVQDLKSRGIRIDAIGEQGHYNLSYPDVSQLQQMFEDFSKIDVEVLITELDLDVLPNASNIQGADLDAVEGYDEKYNPFKECLPEQKDAEIARRWEQLFNIFVQYAADIEVVTFWGVSDAASWLNHWPVQGRTNYPLLFNRDLSAKNALKSVLDTATPQ